jgi:hypothetical protein
MREVRRGPKGTDDGGVVVAVRSTDVDTRLRKEGGRRSARVHAREGG